MDFSKQDIAEFKSLINNWATAQQAKEIILDSKGGWGGTTQAFKDIAWNIWEWFWNLYKDVVNMPLSALWQKTLWGEDYKGGILERSLQTAREKWFEASQKILWVNEAKKETGQTEFESWFQWAMKIVEAPFNILWDVFMSSLSTLTPDKQKEQIKSKIEEIAQTEWGMKAVSAIDDISFWLKEMKKQNPRAMWNIEWLATFLEGLTAIYWGQAVSKTTKQATEWLEGGIKRIKKAGVYKSDELIEQQIKEQTQPRKTIFQSQMEQRKIKKMRDTEAIAWNILQPYKGMVDNLKDANVGLQRVIKEWNLADIEEIKFSDLLSETNQMLSKYGRMLDDELKSIKFEYKDDSLHAALSQLDDIYSGVASKEMRNKVVEIKTLLQKHETSGLNPSEMNQVKILHTKANSLFSDVWKESKWFSKDDLRSVRRELKTLIENIAEENGITNIKDVNKIYWELSSTRIALENQVKNLKSYQGRQLPETVWSKAWELLGKIPVISSWLRGVVGELWFALRADKINPIQIESRLKELVKELKTVGQYTDEVKDVVKQFAIEAKALPQKSSFKEAILTENQIIQQSKEALEKARIRVSDVVPDAEEYKATSSIITELNTPDDLLDFRKSVEWLTIAKRDELLKMIDEKVNVINEMNNISLASSWMRGEYGDDLVDAFRDIYRNEVQLKTTKGADKYTTVEFNNSAGFKRFSDIAQEYVDENPWLWDMTVQDLYDSMKAKMINDDISSLRKVYEIEKKDAINILEDFTGENTKTISDKIASKMRISDVDTVRNTINEFAKKFWDKIKDYLEDIIDTIAEKTGARINFFSTRTKEFVWNKLDDIADKVGARAKFMDDTGTGMSGKIDDFNTVGTTWSADIKLVEQYYKSRTWEMDVSDIIKRFEKSSDANKEKILKKAKEFSPLNNYTEHQWRINSYLRNWEWLESTKIKANQVIDELKKLPKYDWDVYRWVSKYEWIEDLKIWDTFSDKAILSSSQSKIVADRFADDVLFEIKSKTGRDIWNFGTMKSEQEVLFLPNTKFVIEDIVNTKDKTIIKMTEK